MWTHPELQRHEVFLRNMTTAQFDELIFSSKRKGEIPYDNEGNAISHANWFPVFLGKAELEHRGLNLRELRQVLS